MVNSAATQFILIEGTDFTRPIFGSGNATTVSSLMRGFGSRAALVGVTSEPNHELGRWTNIEAFGNTYRFLPIAKSAQMLKPISQSANLDLSIRLYQYRRALLQCPHRKVFTRTYTVLWALNRISAPWDICFYYPGLGNPMLIGRKAQYTKYFAKTYEAIQARALQKHVTKAYAAASSKNIDAYNDYILKKGVKVHVEPLPTAVDTTTVYPESREEARAALDVQPDALTLTFVGRLAEVKGIPFLLDAFARLRDQLRAESGREAVFLLAGDGELRESLESRIAADGLGENVRLMGMLTRPQLNQALAASNVCVVGSHTEGFSNAMLEQLAAGRPIVTTDVSGASDLITDGVNGFIVRKRDPNLFAQKIADAASLRGVEAYNLALVSDKYSEANLWRQIEQEWLGAK